ncbi:hypothetical protein [Flagellimonas sp.]|uniref:hypothetical protein n=1 Tax=Flagellimonas sp. TaxID=2058762 RepID=UPI003B522005
MKQFIYTLAFTFICVGMQAQERYVDQIEIGDEIILGNPSGSHYKFVDVPRKNFIIKRGGIADLSTLNKTTVTITEIFNGKEPKVTFKRKDGKKFFRVYKTMTADFDKAVASGELKMIPEKGKAAIVR